MPTQGFLTAATGSLLCALRGRLRDPYLRQLGQQPSATGKSPPNKQISKKQSALYEEMSP